MAQFKFLCNFGVNLDTRQALINGYKVGSSELQNELLKFPTKEILLVYQYLKFCID